MTAIEVAGLHKHYGDVHALSGVDLQVAQGQVVGLLGPNGAGKTTLVRILTTLLYPDKGTARVLGLDVVRDARRLRTKIGIAGQSVALDEALTGRENLEMFGRLHQLGRRRARTRAIDILEQLGLGRAADRTVATYSGGMRRRLDLGAVLIARPPVIFLDEPTTGLDPRSRKWLWETIATEVACGTTVLLTTQYLEEADQAADRVVVVDRGTVVADGTPSQLKDDVGGDRLAITVQHAGDAEMAATVLAAFATEAPTVDERSVHAIVQQRDGIVSEALRRLDEASVTVTDVSLHRPTLDEVFFQLTRGHEVSYAEESAA